MLRLLITGVLAAMAVGATSASAADEGVAGEFELRYSRHQAENPTPSLEMTLKGAFAVQGGNFRAELTYPLPGGGEEKVALVLRGDPPEAYLLYPETLNYRAIELAGDSTHWLELIPSAAGSYFGAAKEALAKRGVQLSYLGLRELEGEQLSAYAVSMQGGLSLQGAENERAKWSLTLYFSGKPKRMRAAQAKSRASEVKIFISGVRREEVPPARFEVPAEYYALEPITVSEKGPAATQPND